MPAKCLNEVISYRLLEISSKMSISTTSRHASSTVYLIYLTYTMSCHEPNEIKPNQTTEITASEVNPKIATKKKITGKTGHKKNIISL